MSRTRKGSKGPGWEPWSNLRERQEQAADYSLEEWKNEPGTAEETTVNRLDVILRALEIAKDSDMATVTLAQDDYDFIASTLRAGQACRKELGRAQSILQDYGYTGPDRAWAMHNYDSLVAKEDDREQY